MDYALGREYHINPTLSSCLQPSLELCKGCSPLCITLQHVGAGTLNLPLCSGCAGYTNKPWADMTALKFAIPTSAGVSHTRGCSHS